MDSYEALRVRACLRSGVISDRWLPLDGLLFYQAVRRDLGPQELTLPGASMLQQPKGAETINRLPLKYVHAKDWYYHCSWARWSHTEEGQDHWNKRFDVGFADLVDFRGRRGRVTIEKNEYKAYHMPLWYNAALWVEWYCVGDRRDIEELLSTVTHIGKKTSQGWGRVSRWEIEPIEDDWSIWQGDKLMRGIPRYHWPKERPANTSLYGIRPSYWDRRNQVELVMPDGTDE